MIHSPSLSASILRRHRSHQDSKHRSFAFACNLLFASGFLAPLTQLTNNSANPLTQLTRCTIKPITSFIVSWLAALAVLILRATCRIRLHHDPRDQLRANGVPYVYSVLHAHQVAAVIGGEPGTGAMVSRSLDGQIIVPALRVRGVVPVRGSSARQSGDSKGGLEALDALVDHVNGGRPAYLAVDGPRGPRGHVHKGIATLSQRTGAAVINMVAVPSRRWVLRKAWDRMQIPKPFATIDAYFALPVFPLENESVESFRIRIEQSLRALELQHDSAEATAPVRQRTRRAA